MLFLADHPSLRFGDSVHLLDLWADSESNGVIFIEPDFFADQVRPCFQSLGLEISNSVDVATSSLRADEDAIQLLPT